MGDEDFVWSGDDSDRSEDGSRSAAEGDSPFGDLLDRIEGAPDRADVDDLDDLLLSAGEAEEAGDIERFLERIGRGADTTGEVNGPGTGPAAGEEGAPGGRPTGPPSVDDLPEVGGDDEADAVASGADAPTEPGKSFGDLRERVDREAGRSGAGDPSGSWAVPADAGSLPADDSGILLVGSAGGAGDFDACLSILRETTVPRRTNLLLVWLGRDLAGRLERLYERYADRSTDVTVVCRSKVEESLRAESAIPADGLAGDLTIKRISDPRDLPKLGIAISQAIGGSAGGSKETVMCFHSITDLLQFASQERVFRFLHVLQGRIDSIDATAYYHIDREAHEEPTVATFWNLFDATIDLAGG